MNDTPAAPAAAPRRTSAGEPCPPWRATGREAHDGPGAPDFRHYAGQCSPLCRAAACSCGHCFYDHAITLVDDQRHSCTTGCRCAKFADSGLSIQARAVISAVLEAVGIPYGASVGDGERYNELLATRVMHLSIALRGMTDRPAGQWQLDYLRERLAECPVTYRTDYAEVLADMRREAGK